MLRLVDAHAVDVVLCWKWDRFIREPLDLEYLIPRFDKAGVRFAEADGIIDLGTDSGRLAARILVAVAKAEQERKSERQKLANEAAAVNGQAAAGHAAPVRVRRGPRDPAPEEGPAVAEACGALLGGGTHQRGDAGVDQGRAGAGAAPSGAARPVDPDQHPHDLAEPADRRACRSTGARSSARATWEPLVAEETWRAVRGILEDPARKPPRGVRTLLGGLACARAATWSPGCQSHTGHHIYRCAPADPQPRPIRAGMWRGRPRRWRSSSTKLVIARLSRAGRRRPGGRPEGGPDVGGAAGGGGGDPGATWRRWPLTGRWA